MKSYMLIALRITSIIAILLLSVAVFIKIKSVYTSNSDRELVQKTKDDATRTLAILDHMKEMINNDYTIDSYMNDIAQMKFALTSRDKICSLEEKDYIKIIDLNDIKSRFNDNYTYYQTDSYFKLQDAVLKITKLIDIGKKYSEDYPNYVILNAFKLKNTISNYSDCTAKNIITEKEYETFLKTYRSYENETIDQFKNKIKKDLEKFDKSV